MSRKNVQEERRLQIFNALHSILLTKPFHELSTRELASMAEVNHGMLYYFFNSKEDILLQFIDYTIEKYSKTFSDWLQENWIGNKLDQTFINDLFAFISQKITFNMDLSKIFIEIWAVANYSETVRDKLKALYDEWEKRATEMLIKSGLDKKSAEIVSTVIVTSFEGVSLFSILQKERITHFTEILMWHRDRIIDLIP